MVATLLVFGLSYGLMAVRRVPFPTWLRLQRMIEGSQTVCLLLSHESMARSSAGLTVRVERAADAAIRPSVVRARLGQPQTVRASIATTVPVLGVTEATLIYILGSLGAALVIDGFGLLGAAAIPVTATRVLGILLAVAGFLLARR